MQSGIGRTLFAVATIAVTAGFNLSAARAQVSCGATITEKVDMTGDLSCPGDNPAFTINGGGVDMAGYQLTACAGCTGVAISSSGGSLLNGSIVGSGGGSIGVSLAGGAKVENVVVVGPDTGFSSSSGGNKLKNCAAYASSFGFDLTGDKNKVSRSHSSGSTSANFRITGAGNTLNENVSANTTAGSGIAVVGNSNKLSRNNCSSDELGASVSGNENKLSLISVAGSAGDGLALVGDENKVSKTTTVNSTVSGISVTGNLNKLTANASYDADLAGIRVNGSENSVNSSNVGDGGNVGIEVTAGDANSFKSNVTMRNGINGVLLANGVTNSSLSKTVALGNLGPDLQDDNANCGSNFWNDSIFGTSEANGVSGDACIE
jgi:hypothetical protein